MKDYTQEVEQSAWKVQREGATKEGQQALQEQLDVGDEDGTRVRGKCSACEIVGSTRLTEFFWAFGGQVLLVSESLQKITICVVFLRNFSVIGVRAGARGCREPRSGVQSRQPR
jgi:hypothetical protein